jgi:hypothetical protein
MKNLFVTSVLILTSFFSFSQKITVHVTEVKDYLGYDSVSYTVAMSDSNLYENKRIVDGTYNIDLDNKTISFKTLKNEGTRTINSFTKNGNTVSVTYTDIYLNNKNGDKLEMTLVINKKRGKVVLTYFDPLNKYTFAQDFTKNKIKINN